MCGSDTTNIVMREEGVIMDVTTVTEDMVGVTLTVAILSL